MNTIILNSEKALEIFDDKLLDIIKEENDFFYLDGLKLNISYSLDTAEMEGYLCDTEDECWEIINLLEKTLVKLKSYTDSFEVIYFYYGGEYSVCMWKYDGEKLKCASDWIGDYLPENEDDYETEEEYENAQYGYVDEITPQLKAGNVSNELRKSLLDDLNEWK